MSLCTAWEGDLYRKTRKSGDRPNAIHIHIAAGDSSTLVFKLPLHMVNYNRLIPGGNLALPRCNTMSYRLLSLPLLSIPFLALPAYADSSTDLDPILVTASRLDNPLNTAASVTIISSDDIKNSPLRTIPELLASYAGINTNSFFSHGTTGKIDIRGFGETAVQNTLILLDGRRLNDIDTSNINFASIPYENIERIEIIRGAGAVLYGDGATGGVINIITKSPTETDSYSHVSVTAGSHDHYEANVSTTINHEKFGLTANVNSITDGGYRDNNEYKQTSGQIDFRLPINNDEFYLKIGGYDSKINFPGVRTFRPTDIVAWWGVSPVDISLITDRRGTDTPDDNSNEHVYFLNTGYTVNLYEKSSLILDGGIRKKRVKALFPSFFDFTNTEHTALSFTPRFSHDSTLAIGNLNTLVGMDFYSHDYDSISAWADRRVDQQNQSFYWQSSLSLTEQTIITAGIRTDQVKFDGFNVISNSYLNKTDRENSYELGLRQFINESWSAYARTGKNVRFANVDEQLGAFGGLSDLNPQLARSHEVGLSFNTQTTRNNISLFHQNLTDEIRYNPSTFSNENLDKTRRKGVEVSSNITLFDGIELSGNYSYTSAKFRDGVNNGNTIPLVAEHTYNLGLNAELPYNIQSTLNWHHVSNSYFANDMSNDFGLKIPSYQTLNLKLSKNIENLQLALTVNNLFNEKYYTFAINGSAVNGNFNAYPLAERTIYLTASYQFN